MPAASLRSWHLFAPYSWSSYLFDSLAVGLPAVFRQLHLKVRDLFRTENNSALTQRETLTSTEPCLHRHQQRPLSHDNKDIHLTTTRRNTHVTTLHCTMDDHPKYDNNLASTTRQHD